MSRLRILSVLLASVACHAASEPQFGSELNAETNDLFLSCVPYGTIEEPIDGWKLNYVFYTLTTGARRILIPKNDYFCRLVLYDKEGNEMRHTSRKAFGSRFHDLDLHLQKGRRIVQKTTMAFPSNGVIQPFYSPQELFKIPAAGEYVMSLEFQVIEQITTNNVTSFKVVRFPPLKYTFESARASWMSGVPHSVRWISAGCLALGIMAAILYSVLKWRPTLRSG